MIAQEQESTALDAEVEEEYANVNEGVTLPAANRVLVALPVRGHPRDSLRIDMLLEAGFDVHGAAFDRPYHQGRMPNCDISILGSIDHGDYVRRVWKMLRAVPVLRRAMAENEIVYASGADMALICLISGVGLRRPIVVEIGDIRELQVADGLAGRIVRVVDRLLVRACSLIVATAPRFLDVYYREWLGTSTPGLVVENKIERRVFELAQSVQPKMPSGTPFVDRPLRVGYFGLLRDEWSWQVLETWARKNPQRVEIHLAGMPMSPLDNLEERIKDIPNIFFSGLFRSPEDLPSLYNRVDAVWACYPPIKHDNWNLKWARPNRFYQSCLFCKPVLTRAGSQDAIDVEKYDIGQIVECERIDEVVEMLDRIDPSDVDRWTANMRALPESVYVYTSEVDNLRTALFGILNATRS